MGIRGKVAIVTGAAVGTGRTIIQRLINDETAAGHVVVLRRGRAAHTLTQSAECNP